MAAVEAELLLCLVRVGALRFLFEPSAVRSIEGVYRPKAGPEADATPNVDLRAALEIPPAERAARPESLLVTSPSGGQLRLIVCEIEQIVRGQLQALHALPVVLRSYGRRLGLRGVTELPRGGLAYLVAPAELGAALLSKGAA